MLELRSKPMINLFNQEDFSKYGQFASKVVFELNEMLREESSKSTATNESISILKKDMLINPDLYLSPELVSNLD